MSKNVTKSADLQAIKTTTEKVHQIEDVQTSDRVAVTPNNIINDDVAGADEDKIAEADFLSNSIGTNIVLFNEKEYTQTDINHTINSSKLVESTNKQMSEANQALSLLPMRADSDNNSKPNIFEEESNDNQHFVKKLLCHMVNN